MTTKKFTQKLGQLLNKNVNLVKRSRAAKRGGNGGAKALSMAPATVSTPAYTQRTSIREVSDAMLGQGVRLSGVTTVAQVSAYAGFTGPFYAHGDNVRISPVILYGMLSQYATMYTQYRFRSVRFDYIPSCSSQTSGSLRFAVLIDSGARSSPGEGYPEADSFVTLGETQYNVTAQAWQPASLNLPNVPGVYPSYFCRYEDTEIVFTRRPNTQLTLAGRWDSLPISSGLVGTIIMSYTCDFYNRAFGIPVQQALLSMPLRSRADLEQRRAEVEKVFARLTAALPSEVKEPPVSHAGPLPRGGAGDLYSDVYSSSSVASIRVDPVPSLSTGLRCNVVRINSKDPYVDPLPVQPVTVEEEPVLVPPAAASPAPTAASRVAKH